MIHRSESEYGENLFLVWSSSGNVKVDGSEPVENWYAEIKDHVFNKEPTTLKTGKFSFYFLDIRVNVAIENLNRNKNKNFRLLTRRSSFEVVCTSQSNGVMRTEDSEFR